MAYLDLEGFPSVPSGVERVAGNLHWLQYALTDTQRSRRRDPRKPGGEPAPAASQGFHTFLVRQASRTRSAPAFEPAVWPFLGKTCAGRHNAQMKAGSLDLRSLRGADPVARNLPAWRFPLQTTSAVLR